MATVVSEAIYWIDNCSEHTKSDCSWRHWTNLCAEELMLLEIHYILTSYFQEWTLNPICFMMLQLAYMDQCVLLVGWHLQLSINICPISSKTTSDTPVFAAFEPLKNYYNIAITDSDGKQNRQNCNDLWYSKTSGSCYTPRLKQQNIRKRYVGIWSFNSNLLSNEDFLFSVTSYYFPYTNVETLTENGPTTQLQTWFS